MSERGKEGAIGGGGRRLLALANRNRRTTQLGALRLPLGRIQLPDDAVSSQRVRPPQSGRFSARLGGRTGN